MLIIYSNVDDGDDDDNYEVDNMMFDWYDYNVDENGDDGPDL